MPLKTGSQHGPALSSFIRQPLGALDPQGSLGHKETAPFAVPPLRGRGLAVVAQAARGCQQGRLCSLGAG